MNSFAQAATALELAGLTISAKHVRQLTQEVGREMAAQRDARAVERRRRTLKPRVGLTPKAVVVEVDGGRLRTRQADAGRGVHQARGKEEKVAAFVSLDGPTFEHDPCPQPPAWLLDCRRVQRLVRQMQGQAADPSQGQSEQADGDEIAEPPESLSQPMTREDGERWSPKKRLMTCVASMADSDSFGPMMAAEAQTRDFYTAARRAFVADGAAYNWTIQKGYFPDFEPIVDLMHVVCHVYNAAVAAGGADEGEGGSPPDGGGRPSGWEWYTRWVGLCWSGMVSSALEEMRSEQSRVGLPPEGESLSKSDPREVLRESLVYLDNNASRMDYPRYRREGLPTTSSLVESLVGQFNARVKDRRKFWNRPEGGEQVLQVRASLLSEDGRLERHFMERPGCPYRRRTTADRLSAAPKGTQ